MSQGLHRLEKYLSLEGFLEKSMKIKPALKSTGKLLKGLEKSLNSLFSLELNTVDRDLNQYKIVVPLFGAANAAPNKDTTISSSFSCTICSISQPSILKNLNTSISIFPKLLVLENCKTVLRSP